MRCCARLQPGLCTEFFNFFDCAFRYYQGACFEQFIGIEVLRGRDCGGRQVAARQVEHFVVIGEYRQRLFISDLKRLQDCLEVPRFRRIEAEIFYHHDMSGFCFCRECATARQAAHLSIYLNIVVAWTRAEDPSAAAIERVVDIPFTRATRTFLAVQFARGTAYFAAFFRLVRTLTLRVEIAFYIEPDACSCGSMPNTSSGRSMVRPVSWPCVLYTVTFIVPDCAYFSMTTKAPL